MDFNNSFLLSVAIITHVSTAILIILHARGKIGNTMRQKKIFTVLITVSVLAQVSNDISAVFMDDFLPYTLSDVSYVLTITGTLLYVCTESEFLRVLEPISDVPPYALKIGLYIIIFIYFVCVLPLAISIAIFFGVPYRLPEVEYRARFPLALEKISIVWTGYMVLFISAMGTILRMLCLLRGQQILGKEKARKVCFITTLQVY